MMHIKSPYLPKPIKQALEWCPDILLCLQNFHHGFRSKFRRLPRMRYFSNDISPERLSTARKLAFLIKLNDGSHLFLLTRSFTIIYSCFVFSQSYFLVYIYISSSLFSVPFSSFVFFSLVLSDILFVSFFSVYYCLIFLRYFLFVCFVC